MLSDHPAQCIILLLYWVVYTLSFFGGVEGGMGLIALPFCAGISFKTQALYVAVFSTRYLDLFYNFISVYNTFMKIVFIASASYTLYLMRYKYRCVLVQFSLPSPR